MISQRIADSKVFL